jgi:hypothetical protein
MLAECVGQLDEPFRRSEIIGWFHGQQVRPAGQVLNDPAVPGAGGQCLGDPPVRTIGTRRLDKAG